MLEIFMEGFQIGLFIGAIIFSVSFVTHKHLRGDPDENTNS